MTNTILKAIKRTKRIIRADYGESIRDRIEVEVCNINIEFDEHPMYSVTIYYGDSGNWEYRPTIYIPYRKWTVDKLAHFFYGYLIATEEGK